MGELARGSSRGWQTAPVFSGGVQWETWVGGHRNRGVAPDETTAMRRAQEALRTLEAADCADQALADLNRVVDDA